MRLQASTDEGNFYALNDQTGKALWDFQTWASSCWSCSSDPFSGCAPAVSECMSCRRHAELPVGS